MSNAEIRVQAGCLNGSTKTTVKVRQFELTVDEPPFFGGEDLAPSPVEYLLAGLAGCVSAIAHTLAKETGIVFQKMDICVEGDISADKFFDASSENRAGFTEIRIDIAVKSEADDAQLSAWKEQVLSRCPLIDNLRQPTSVQMSVSAAP